ncbi:SPOR domain-containing protein [Pararhodobacter sp.]|uniref:SPOR domain-containing protein n=1 Tax=Pararhodobacter sp. TaxID=2127056 RepID=UPI002FDD30CA
MFVKFVSAAALLAALGATGAAAQTRSGPVIPAEMPPASFTGGQYVDSRGCIFMRAGYNGRVNWVPRYGDDRRPMCGYAPSMAASGPAPVVVAAAPVAAPAPRSAPAPRVTVTSGIPYSVPPEPSRPHVQPVAPAQVHHVSGSRGLDTRWSFYDRTGPSPCSHLSPHSQMYMVPSPAMPELPLRCGPQARHTTDAVREMAPRGNVWEPWDGVNPSPMAPNVYQLPPPYAPRWPDAHLQPTAPRGHAASVQQVAQVQAPRTTVSTMGSAASVTPAAPGRYVQVGTFGVDANAQTTIARLQQHGLPVATGSVRRGDQALQVVMAGPFANPAEAQAALGAARALGFGDAFVR